MNLGCITPDIPRTLPVYTGTRVPAEKISFRHRVDSIEAMLAEIPSRFSIQKCLSIGSASSSASSSQTPLGVGHGALGPQCLPGTAAIPSRQSREAPGLQPATSALRQPCGPPGSHVTPDAGADGEMPRYPHPQSPPCLPQSLPDSSNQQTFNWCLMSSGLSM